MKSPPPTTDDWRRPRPREKRTKPFAIEWRLRPNKNRPDSMFKLTEWQTYRRYESEVDRAQALETLNAQDCMFEYRNV